MMENLKVGLKKAEEFIISGRCCYKGEFKGWIEEGRGIYSHNDRAVYDGEFKSGQPEGRAVCKCPSGWRICR